MSIINESVGLKDVGLVTLATWINIVDVFWSSDFIQAPFNSMNELLKVDIPHPDTVFPSIVKLCKNWPPSANCYGKVILIVLEAGMLYVDWIEKE